MQCSRAGRQARPRLNATLAKKRGNIRMNTQSSIRKFTIVCYAIIATIFLPSAQSLADVHLPSIVLDGLTAYQAAGPDAAIKSWLKGSAVETSPEAQSQANVFRQVESMYGKYIGYDTVKVKELTKTSSLAFITINYERGPLFAMFVCYRGSEKWIISSFNFHTKPEQVMPPSMFSE